MVKGLVWQIDARYGLTWNGELPYNSGMNKQTAPIQATAKICLRLLNIARTAIKKQGTGCYNEMGVAYYTKGRNDVITSLCAPKTIRSYTYGVVSGEEQRYIVAHIANRYQVRIDRADTYTFLVDFLQDLQDAHDDAFDPFLDIDDRMQKFDELTLAIFTKLNRKLTNG